MYHPYIASQEVDEDKPTTARRQERLRQALQALREKEEVCACCNCCESGRVLVSLDSTALRVQCSRSLSIAFSCACEAAACNEGMHSWVPLNALGLDWRVVFHAL